MKQTKLIMGMPVTVEILDEINSPEVFKKIFSYFTHVDSVFSTYKKDSEISKINRGDLNKRDFSAEVVEVLNLCVQARAETNGFFNAYKNGFLDPSGIVKGWAILNASKLIKREGFKNFYVEAGGDIQIMGKKNDKNWMVGIRNPFNQTEIVKKIIVTNKGVATSGTYIRGQHIYNPFNNKEIQDIVSITVIGPNIFEADKFATAAFAMGKNGINFIEKLKNFEGYIIDKEGIATYTSGFERYVE